MPISKTKGKQTRVIITEQQKEILQRYWDEGMDRYSSPDKVQQIRQASEETGLPVRNVKNWINNRRKKERKEKGLWTRRKPVTLFPKKVSAQRVFMSDYFRQQGMKTAKERREAMKSAPAAWNMLREEDPEKVAEYEEAADEKNKQLDNDRNLSEAQRKALTRKTMKKIGAMCEKLEKATCSQTSVMCSHQRDGVSFTGSSFGPHYMYASSNAVSEVLALNYAVGANRSAIRETKLIWIKLAEEVTQMFNAKYKEATGKESVEYGKIKAGLSSHHMVGLPDGIDFKKPRRYGTPKLLSILEARDSIQFVAREHQESTSPTESKSDTKSIPIHIWAAKTCDKGL